MIYFEDVVMQQFRQLYEEKRETIEFMCKYGTIFEKAKANLIKDVALYK